MTKTKKELLKENFELKERLESSHETIKNTIESLNELFPNQFIEDNFYIELVGELAPNKTLFLKIEDSVIQAIGTHRDFRFGLITYDVYRYDKDTFIVSDTSNEWVGAEISLNILKGLISGKYDITNIEFN